MNPYRYKSSNLKKYLLWLEENNNLSFSNYEALWEWSVQDIEAFWETIVAFFQVKFYTPYSRVLVGNQMPFYTWFENGTLNYTQQILCHDKQNTTAVIEILHGGEIRNVLWSELKRDVSILQAFLKNKKITKGDCVVAYLPNNYHAFVSFLAVSSLGAVWSSCSPDFGVRTVVDRFEQITPKILIASFSYHYGGKCHDISQNVFEISTSLESLSCTLVFDKKSSSKNKNSYCFWQDIVKDLVTTTHELEIVPVGFSHPLWVLYSSGTTGKPKAITHSHGGCLIEHLKYISLHNDVKDGERYFWYTTTAWMMWNYLIGTMLCGAVPILYSENIFYPTPRKIWEILDKLDIQHFGASGTYFKYLMKKDINLKYLNLTKIRSIGSTGSVFPKTAFDYIYRNIHSSVWISSISGGTDVCSVFVGSTPFRSVFSGYIQCRALGCALSSYDDDGNPISDAMGEMVIEKPMPSMPIYFWNDRDKSKYIETYFNRYLQKWHHGDLITISHKKGIIIHGRSDATLNFKGVRMGTSEIYNVLDVFEEIEDAVVVDFMNKKNAEKMPLFLKIKSGYQLDERLKRRIRRSIRTKVSPRHLPTDIIRVTDIPYTMNGKKMEVLVKQIMYRKDISDILDKGVIRNPKSTEDFIGYSKLV